MAIKLFAPSRYVVKSARLPFSVSGASGTPVFSIVAGPGSINSSTGLFYSDTMGKTLVKVTDGAGKVDTLQVIIATPFHIVCDIIREGLGLEDGRVWLWDQKIAQPIDDKIFAAVRVVRTKCFATSSTFDDAGNEVLSASMYANLDIDIQSRSSEARDRFEEVIMSLQSIYSQQMQELNGFYIAQISPTANDLSNVDGAAIPYRFVVSCSIQYKQVKIKSADYYDNLSDTELTTEP